MLGVSAPVSLVDDEQEQEHEFVVEVARDVAFALHDIQRERQRVLAAREREALLEAPQIVLSTDDFVAAARQIFEICKAQTGATSGYVATGPENDDFMNADKEFYRNVDWALDVSRAEYMELELHGVPAHLVRRDPNTQVVVKRERIIETQDEWEAMELGGTPWQIALRSFLAVGFADQVLVAPKRGKDFAKWNEGLQRLRDAGIAEPD